MNAADPITSVGTQGRPTKRRGKAVLWLLRSPGRGLVDRRVCALRLTTRRSNMVIEFPVQYARVPGGVLIVAGNSSSKTWWRNLARPAPVEVWLDGKWCRGSGRLLRPGGAKWAAALARYRAVYRRTPADIVDPVVEVRLPEVGTAPQPAGRRLWRTWVAWVTAGEVMGFIAPAVAGTLTAGLAGLGAVPWLLAAGAVEGAALGAAQAHVLGRVLPSLSKRQWVAATAAAAMVAYLLGLVPSMAADAWRGAPTALVVSGAGVLGLGLLLSIGVAQWTVLRRHLAHARQWIGWTAAGWLVGLAVFMMIAPPLWHVGQPVWLTVAVGLLAGFLMAAAAAAVTGVGLLRVLRSPQR